MEIKSEWMGMPKYLYGIAILYVIFSTIFDSSYLISAIIALFCSRQCYIYSIKMKINPYIGFAAGLIFSLFGLIVYFIMFKFKSKKKKGKEKKVGDKKS